jgi:hypothetical protein
MTATVTPAPSVSPHTPENPSACCPHGVAVGGATPWPLGQPVTGPGNWPAGTVEAAWAAADGRITSQDATRITTTLVP